MEKSDIFISKSLIRFAKGSLVVIGLFAILYCVVAAFVIRFNYKLDINFLLLVSLPLIVFFLVSLITLLIIFFRFYTLMELHDKELVNLPDNNTHNAEIHKYNQRIDVMKEIIEEYLKIARAIKHNSSVDDKEILKGVLVELLEKVFRKSSE